MTDKGKMIQLYLHDGNTEGIKIASTTRRELNAVMIPRQLLAQANKEIKELQNIGLYFLFGITAEGEEKVYIGEASNVGSRLKDHDKCKDFWDVAIAIVSPSTQNQYNHSELLFLEKHSIQLAETIKRYDLENGNKGRESTVPNWRLTDLLNDVDIIKTLTGVLGYPVFETLKYNKTGEFFFCEGRGVKAKGEMVDGGFVVHKGSQMALEPVPSFAKLHPKYMEAIKGLEKRNLIKKEKTHYVFVKEVIFPSVSAASSIVLQRNCSGKTTWKTESGKCLKEAVSKI